MDNGTITLEKATILNTGIITLAKAWHALRDVGKTWNLKTATQAMDKLGPLSSDFEGIWQAAREELSTQLDAIRDELASPSYAAALEKALKAYGVPLTGSFPAYMLPPFKLTVSTESLEARLSMGRKNERTSELAPEKLAQWVAVRYKKVTQRRFNSQAFLKDLLEAYHIANRLNFREATPKYGLAVPLMELYDILTLRAGARQEYPSQFFIFDLGLLMESGAMETERYRFELGTAKEQKRAIVVVDGKGVDHRVSSLTVHEKEGVR
jgi:hypothetical protein